MTFCYQGADWAVDTWSLFCREGTYDWSVDRSRDQVEPHYFTLVCMRLIKGQLLLGSCLTGI